jgi:hypothetical protein
VSTNRVGRPGGWLDWREHRVGPGLPCRLCGRPAICRDDDGRPCHKVCAEQPDTIRAEASTPDMREPIPMPRNESPLGAALACAARGWHVFPLRPGDKRPAIDRWEQRATTDPDRIRRCWSAGPYNIGIACGPSRMVVIDLDMPKPGQTPPVEWAEVGATNGDEVFAHLCHQAGQPLAHGAEIVVTGRGGIHRYFAHPADGPELRNTAGALGWLIDTRAHGGYVVAAGSIVAGHEYRTDLRARHGLDPLPHWLAERLRPAPLRPAGPPVVIDLPADRCGAYVRAAIDGTLAKLGEAGEGTRNDALFMAAQTLGQLVAGGMVAEDVVTDVLTDAARRLGLRPGETAKTIRSGLAAGGRRPRTVAA